MIAESANKEVKFSGEDVDKFIQDYKDTQPISGVLNNQGAQPILQPRELSELDKLKIENIKLKITNHNLSAHFLENQGRQLEAEKSQLEKELGIEIK